MTSLIEIEPVGEALDERPSGRKAVDRALADIRASSTYITLMNREIDDDAVAYFASNLFAAAAGMRRPLKVDLSLNPLTSAGVVRMCRALAEVAVESVDFAWCKDVNDEGGLALLQLIERTPGLQRAEIGDTEITSELEAKIEAALAKNRIASFHSGAAGSPRRM